MIKRHRKLLILVVILGLVFLGIIGSIMLNSKPDKLSEAEKEKAIAGILGRKPNMNANIKTGNTAYDGKNIYFEYPAKAVIYDYVSENKKKNKSIIEMFSFDIDNPRLILNYSAEEKTGLTDLDDEPAVSLREDKSRGYIREEIEIDGVSGLSYSKEAGGGDRAEHSIFILKDGVLYSISVSGASLEDVNELFEQIISSAVFK